MREPVDEADRPTVGVACECAVELAARHETLERRLCDGIRKRRLVEVEIRAPQRQPLVAIGRGEVVDRGHPTTVPPARPSFGVARAVPRVVGSSARDDERVALPAAAAQRDRGGSSASAHELVHGVDDEAVAGCADRVADRDAAAVDVHDVVR